MASRSPAQVRAQKRFTNKYARANPRRRKNPRGGRSAEAGARSINRVLARMARKGASAADINKMSKKLIKKYAPGPQAPRPKKRKTATKGKKMSKKSTKSKSKKGKTKHQMRVDAGKKAWRTRRAKEAARKASAKRSPKKRKYSRRRTTVRALTKKIKSASRSLKYKGKNTRSRRMKRRVIRSRRSALTLQRYALKHSRGKGKMPKGARAKMRAYGLTRVNPSLKEVGKGLVALLPEMGAAAVSLGVVAWGSMKLGDQLQKSMKPDNKLLPWLPAISSGVLATVWYALLRMAGPAASKYAGPALMGGAAATAVHLLKSVQVGPEGQKMSLGSKLGLPIGEYASVSGYRASLAGWQSGHEGAYLGDYERAMIGEYTSVGSIFNGSSLGAVPRGALPGGREARHGIDGETTVEQFVGDGGSLSGGIFD